MIIKTNTEYESYFWVKWEQSGSQDIPNNRTTIAWSCGVYCGHTFALNAIRMSAVTINGVKVYGGGTYSNYSKGDHIIASGTLRVDHNTDGTKTLVIAPFTGWLYSNHNYSSNGGSYSLTTIPRQAVITAAYDFTDVGNPSITFSNPGGFPMDVWLEPNPVGDHLCVRENIPNTGSYTWTLTDAEREALRSKCPRNTCTIRLGLYTYIGGVQYADYEDKIYTMTENEATKPSVSVEVSPNNDGLPSVFDDMYIQGVSKIDVKLSAEGKYGAGIDLYYARIEDKAYSSGSFTTGVIQSTGDVDIIAQVEDSRWFTGATYTRINVVEYSKPSVNAIAYRCNSSGEEDDEGAYMRVGFDATFTSLNGKNNISYTINYGDTPIEGSGTSYLSDPIECDVSRVWSVEVKVADLINTTTKAAVIPIAFTLMDFHNTGMGVSFGKVATREGFDCAMPAYFGGEVYVDELPLTYIVEEGRDGIWTYRKWSSGKSECWGTFTQDNVAVDGTWGALFQSREYTISLPRGLFIEEPLFGVTLYGGPAILSNTYTGASTGSSIYYTISMRAVTPVATSLGILKTSVVAYGKWK